MFISKRKVILEIKKALRNISIMMKKDFIVEPPIYPENPHVQCRSKMLVTEEPMEDVPVVLTQVQKIKHTVKQVRPSETKLKKKYVKVTEKEKITNKRMTDKRIKNKSKLK